MAREQLQKEGKEAPELFDSNAISPGTRFMQELGRQLRSFIEYKLSYDPMYQRVRSIFIVAS